jgi:hypothetical protein
MKNHLCRLKTNILFGLFANNNMIKFIGYPKKFSKEFKGRTDRALTVMQKKHTKTVSRSSPL